MNGNESTGQGGRPEAAALVEATLEELWRAEGVGGWDGCKELLRVPRGSGLQAVSGQAPAQVRPLSTFRPLQVVS